MKDNEYIFGSIFLLANKLQIIGDDYLKEITLKQWFLLVMIENIGKKELTVTELAKSIGSSRQNVRKMLDVLAKRGYVTLMTNPNDKRNLTVELAEKTYTFFSEFDQKGTDFLEILFSDVNSNLLANTKETIEKLFVNINNIEEGFYEKDSGNL